MNFLSRSGQRIVTLTVSLGFVVVSLAQISAPEFDAASVRPAPLRQRMSLGGVKRGGPGTSDPGRIVYESVSLARLIMDAYGVDADQLQGPAWAIRVSGADARYDVQATLPIGVSAQQFEVMLQHLLSERFHLRVHRQPRQVPGYALLASRTGPKVIQSRGPVSDAEKGATGSNGEYKLQDVAVDGFPRLFPWANFGASVLNGVVRMRFRDFTLRELADGLAYTLAARIEDATSLRASYDFTLEFVPPESGIATVHAIMGAPRDRHLMFINAPDQSQFACVPILSSALEKQLGLKLEARKVMIDALVIDGAEKIPEAN